MDWQTLINIGIVVVGGAVGFFVRTLWNAVDKLAADLTNLRVHLPEAYVPKDDFQLFERRLFDRLERIEKMLVEIGKEQG